MARTNSLVGTLEYVSPEIAQGNEYDKRIDWWSYGIFIYEMLFGFTPFKGEGKDLLYNICFQPLKFPPLEKRKLFCLNKTISHAAKDFIQCLLDKDPNRRMVNPRDMKKHPFFSSIDFKRIYLIYLFNSICII